MSSAQAGARWLEDHGRALEALVVYDRTPTIRRSPGCSAQSGSELVAAGRVDVVADAAASVPAPLRTDALDLLEGEARQVRGDNDGALVCFRRLIPEDGPVPAAVAWRVGLALHLRGDLAEAFDIYERGLDGGGTERDRALVRGWLAAATFRQGDEVRCRELGADALTSGRVGRRRPRRGSRPHRAGHGRGTRWRPTRQRDALPARARARRSHR